MPDLIRGRPKMMSEREYLDLWIKAVKAALYLMEGSIKLPLELVDDVDARFDLHINREPLNDYVEVKIVEKNSDPESLTHLDSL